ncbi:MAG: hypothetical protein GY862_04295, partial [Gammaproteobacteria bacterium]|nr:hypothetical protein [Gammaproteobacteria bacterium]
MRKNRSRKPKSISKSKTGDIRELQELLGQLHDNWHITGCLTEPYFSSGRKIERLPVEEPLKPPAQFAAAGEELQAFCQSYAERWTLALNRANSGRELEAFANVFSSQELADLTDRHTRLFASLGKACHAAVSRSLSQPMLALTLDLFILPSLLEKYAWTNSADEYLQPRRTALRTNGGSGLSPLQQCMTHVLLLLLDAFCEGTEVAFNRFAGYWLNQHNDRMVHAAFTAPLWHCLYRSGWRHDAKLFKRIMNRYADTLGQLNEQHTNLQIFLIVNLLGYNLQSSREWNKMVFDNLIVPSIQRALKKKNYSYAHRLIERTDFSYAQQPHTEEQECLCREAWQPATLDAARGIRLNLPALQSCCQTHMPPVIAFVIDLEINRCSPIAVLFNMLLSTAKADRKEFVASVYSFHKVEPEVEVRFGNIGISVTDMSRIRGPLENDDFLRRLLALRDIMRGDRVDVTVYVHSTMFFITFASAAGLSPIQVFWSMGGYYSFRIKEIQGYITLGNVFEHLKDINGHDWRIVSGRMLPPGSDKLISQKAKQIREQH